MCNVRTVGIACFICSVIIFALIAGTHVRLARFVLCQGELGVSLCHVKRSLPVQVWSEHMGACSCASQLAVANTSNATASRADPEKTAAEIAALSSAMEAASPTAARQHKEDPLVFNIPEVPNEVRGVFHKSTGNLNYTALVEFVKNMKLNATGDWICARAAAFVLSQRVFLRVIKCLSSLE